jgi:hypothetical protein
MHYEFKLVNLSQVGSVLTFHRDNRMYEWTAATRLPIGQGDQ